MFSGQGLHWAWEPSGVGVQDCQGSGVMTSHWLSSWGWGCGVELQGPSPPPSGAPCHPGFPPHGPDPSTAESQEHPPRLPHTFCTGRHRGPRGTCPERGSGGWPAPLLGERRGKTKSCEGLGLSRGPPEASPPAGALQKQHSKKRLCLQRPNGTGFKSIGEAASMLRQPVKGAGMLDGTGTPA